MSDTDSHIYFADVRFYLTTNGYPESASGPEGKKKRGAIRRKANHFQINSHKRLIYHKTRLVCETAEQVEAILKETHNSQTGAHVGEKKVLQLIKSRYYWHSIVKDVKDYISTCDRCQRENPKLKAEKPQLHPVHIPPGLFRQWGIDLVGPLTETKHGNKYIVATTCYFSKWCEAQALPSKEGLGITDFLFELYSRYGSAEVIISDQGREFVNEANRKLNETRGVSHRITSAYHPQANGLQERNNQSLQKWLKKVCEEEKCADWDEKLKSVLVASRFTPQGATKYSPFHIVYGREALLPEQIRNLDGFGSDRYCAEFTEEVMEFMIKQRQELYASVQANLAKSQAKMKADYAKKHSNNVYTYKVGDEVLLENTKDKSWKASKLNAPLWSGPYTVVSVTAKGVCKLKNQSGEVLKQAAASARLKKYNRPIEPSTKGKVLREADASLSNSSITANGALSNAPKKGRPQRRVSHEQRVSDLQIPADANSERSQNLDEISDDEVTKLPASKRRRVASGSDSEDSTPKPATCFTFPIRWGGGDDYDITNSCPIDNFLALLLPGANMVPTAAFMYHLEESERPADQALLACLNVLKSGNVGGAKDIWVEFVGSANPGIFTKSMGRTQANLWGHLDGMFLRKFRNDQYLARQLSVCSHSTCPNKMKNTGHKILSIGAPEGGLSLGETVQMQVDVVLAITDEVPCHETVDPDSIAPPDTLAECVKLGTWFDAEAGVNAVHTVCSGTRTVMPDGLPQGTWLIPLDIRLIPCRMLFEMPDKLRAGMYTYRLIGLTVYKNLHKDQDAWYHYDGLGKPMGEKVDRPLLGDSPQYAIYVI